LVFSFPFVVSAPRWQQGGIAQLVERQLCKLDVWGSNPHASTSHSEKAEKLKSQKAEKSWDRRLWDFSISAFQRFSFCPVKGSVAQLVRAPP
jgi:hypothetical protein